MKLYYWKKCTIKLHQYSNLNSIAKFVHFVNVNSLLMQFRFKSNLYQKHHIVDQNRSKILVAGRDQVSFRVAAVDMTYHHRCNSDFLNGIL